MRRLALRITTAVQLTRLTIAFGAVSDIWFVILLTRASDSYVMINAHRMDLPAALFAGAVIAVGLFAYGAALNDVLDARHDSAFSPDRPIPAGRIRLGQAIVVTVAALILAVLGSAALGTWSVCITLFAAAGLLFYNATGKYIPAVGFVTIGLVHATHMFIPNHELAFTLPVWLVMTHVTVIAMLVHVLEDKRPRIGRRALFGTIVGWLFWSAVVLGAAAVSLGRIWPEHVSPWGVAYPTLAVAAFIVTGWYKTRAVTGRAAGEKLKRYGAMWQSLYGASWLLALGLAGEALFIGAFAVAGFVAMTVIKELTGLSGKPIGYRL